MTGRAWSVRRAAVGVLLALLVVSGCTGGAEEPPVAGGEPLDDQTTAGTPDGTTQADAVLGILEAGVDVADEPEAVDGATFRAGEDGEPLVVNDVVRTDASGFAEVRWFEGALARVDVDTLLEVTELDLTTGQPTVSTRLDVGRVWSRLDSAAPTTRSPPTSVPPRSAGPRSWSPVT